MLAPSVTTLKTGQDGSASYVSVGASYVSGSEWTAEAEARVLQKWRFVADAAHAARIHLITNLPIQAWANAVAGIPLSQTNWTTAADWQRWTLGNMSSIKDHPAIAGYVGCDDCCHPGQFGLAVMRYTVSQRTLC